MKPFYSIVYIKPNTLSDEKISIGMVLNTGNRPLFDFSEKKLKAASKLIGTDAIDTIERTLKYVKREIESVSVDVNQVEAFEIEPFTKDYFEYLNRYSNNILEYSKPTENEGSFKVSDFEELFKLFVDSNYGIKIKEEISFKESFENKLSNSRVSDRLDIKYRVSKERVNTIFSNTEVDYIGVNGSIYTGHVLDTNFSHNSLENKIHKIRSLIIGLDGLSKKYKLKSNGEHIVYYNEPDNSKNKDIIHNISKDKTLPFSLKPSEYFEEEEKIFEERNVNKFSEFLALNVL